MKKITLTLCTLLVAGMLLTSCGGGGSVKDSAMAFITAMNKMDLQTAKNYVSAANKPSMDKMAEMFKTLTPDQKKQFDDEVAKRAKYTITIKDVKENGDKATVFFTSSEDPSRTDSIPMVKENGKWVADFKGF
jgi:Domain of unknown function (DUF4878)